VPGGADCCDVSGERVLVVGFREIGGGVEGGCRVYAATCCGEFLVRACGVHGVSC